MTLTEGAAQPPPFTGDFDRLNYADLVEMRLIDAHLAVVAPGVARRAAMVNDVPLIGARHLQHRVVPCTGAWSSA